MSFMTDFFFGSSKAPAPPQYDASLSRELGNEMATLAREQFEWGKTRTAEMDAVTKGVVEQQMRIAGKQEALTDDYTQYMKEVYRPVEREVAGQAIAYNLPEEMEREAGKGRATVAQQFDVQRGVLERNLGRYGFDPNRFAAINERLGSEEAIASAGAANEGRERARTYGHALLMDAASLGRNLPSSQATSAGVAVSAGSQAAGNQRAGDIGAISTSNAALPWYAGAGGAFGQAGGLTMSGYQASLGANVAMRGQNMQHIAQIYDSTADMVGSMVASRSDRRLKSDIVLVGKLTPEIGVYEYTMDGRRQRGVMADEVEKVYPQFVVVAADGYKRVHYPALMAAVR